jgi:outer membrane lipoprotein-sorting protein
MRKYVPFLFLICIILSNFAACAPKAKLIPARMPSASPQEIVTRLSAGLSENTVLRTKARLSVSSERGKHTTGILLFAKNPAYLRIEAISLLGMPELILTANGKELKIFEIKENKFYIAPAGQEISRFFPIHMDAEEMVSLMLGMPLPVKGTTPVLTGHLEEKLYRIDFEADSEIIQRIWLDPARLLLMRVEKTERGVLLFSADLHEYKKVGDVFLPSRIDMLFNTPDNLKITLRFSKSEIEAEKDGIFDMKAPEDAIPVYLD